MSETINTSLLSSEWRSHGRWSRRHLLNGNIWKKKLPLNTILSCIIHISSGNGLVPSCNKPLLELMLKNKHRDFTPEGQAACCFQNNGCPIRFRAHMYEEKWVISPFSAWLVNFPKHILIEIVNTDLSLVFSDVFFFFFAKYGSSTHFKM